MTENRFIERRQGDRRRRWRRIAIGVLIVAVIGAAVWAVWFSALLATRTVAVDGETTLSESQIRTQAQVRIGRPLARVDLVRIESRVASMERIQDVSVSRSWPRTIRITVVERRAIAWVSVGGVVRGLDRFGVDFRSYGKAPDDLVEVKVEATDARQRQQALEAAARVVDVVTKEDLALRRQIQSVSAESLDSISFDLTKGRTVTWGSAADSARKLTVLEALLDIKAASYDVSAPDQPTTRD